MAGSDGANICGRLHPLCRKARAHERHPPRKATCEKYAMDHFMSDDVVYRKKNFCCECAAARRPLPQNNPHTSR